MKLHKIADLYVAAEYSRPTVTKQAEAYLSSDRPDIIDIVMYANEDAIKKTNELYPTLNADDCEYMVTGMNFYSELLHFNGLMIHSSAVVYNGDAYLFSADSGTGKSTHTQLWKKAFPGAEILNDDKPAVRIIDGKAFAYGTPWSGKTDWNLNVRANLKGICFIERAEKNSIRRVEASEIVTELIKQTIRPPAEKKINLMFDNIDKLLKIVPVYKMGCNMNIEAAHVAYEGMK